MCFIRNQKYEIHININKLDNNPTQIGMCPTNRVRATTLKRLPSALRIASALPLPPPHQSCPAHREQSDKNRRLPHQKFELLIKRKKFVTFFTPKMKLPLK